LISLINKFNALKQLTCSLTHYTLASCGFMNMQISPHPLTRDSETSLQI